MTDAKISTYSKFIGYEERNRTENITGEQFGLQFKLQYFGANSSFFGDEIYTLFSPILIQSKNLVSQWNKVRVEPAENDLVLPKPPSPGIASSSLHWNGTEQSFASISNLRGGFLKLDLVYCDQRYLDMIFPGKICKPRAEANAQIAAVQLYVQYFYQYFDGQNFTEPLKV